MKKKLISPFIEFKNVYFAYNQNKNWVLKNLSFQLESGTSLTIIGVNGSGKTTLGKIISGLLLHFHGKISILNQKLTEKNYHKIIRRVGLVFQNPENQFIGGNVEEDIAFGLENLNLSPSLISEKIAKIAQKFNITHLLGIEPINLSGGDKQKVAIASVLATDPQIVVFDEPASLLDAKGKIEILNIIDKMKKEKKIIIIEITHDIERIIDSDLVMVMDKGQILFLGKSENLLTKHQQILTKITELKSPFVYKLSQALVENKIIKKPFLREKKLLDVLCKLKKS